jgi:hypothetical protein
MYYKFEISGLYCGTSDEKIPYSTDVAPPDENVTAKWVWNHYNWVGMPSDWTPVQAEYVPVVEEAPATPAVETPAEETPTEPTT